MFMLLSPPPKLNAGLKLAKDFEGEERLLKGYNRDET